ncbi:hypothetical protein G7Y89_g2730 [Cudoniella acicularis]|uniref:Uncharacterized protein n=1 Tax=Cudoniella acicularis TaxID=354080 RepID=A0A8H4RUV0_9HELO|nr:hypothetical protein G7Y89_g2730 [Cudoniella acicularis]
MLSIPLLEQQKEGDDGDAHMTNLYTASQALYNIYKWMKHVKEDERFEVRLHRAEKQTRGSILLHFDELLPLGRYTKSEVLHLNEIGDYVRDRLFPILQTVFTKVVTAEESTAEEVQWRGKEKESESPDPAASGQEVVGRRPFSASANPRFAGKSRWSRSVGGGADLAGSRRGLGLKFSANLGFAGKAVALGGPGLLKFHANPRNEPDPDKLQKQNEKRALKEREDADKNEKKARKEQAKKRRKMKACVRMAANKAKQQHMEEDKKREELLRVYSEKLKDAWSKGVEGTHFVRTGVPRGQHILKGSLARCVGPSAKYAIVNATQLSNKWAVMENPEILVLRDKKWFEARKIEAAILTSDRFVDSLPDNASVSIHDFGQAEEIVRNISVEEYKRRWKESNGEISTTAMNGLNFSFSSELDVTPEPLFKYSSLLREITDEIMKTAIDAAVGKETERSVHLQRDKDSRTVKIKSSIKGCLRFQINAQAGSVSGFHMDWMGPFTWVTVEGNKDEKDEEVVKLWAIVDLDGLDTEKKAEALADFARCGEGLIHSAMSATNCLCRGGTVLDRRFFVSHHLPIWEFIAEHRDAVTNEDPQDQTQEFLEAIKKDLKRNPEAYKITAEDLPQVQQRIDKIINYFRCPEQLYLCASEDTVGIMQSTNGDYERHPHLQTVGQHLSNHIFADLSTPPIDITP